MTSPPTVYPLVVQVMATLCTLVPMTEPDPDDTTQVCAGLVGCVLTVTAYEELFESAVAKVKVPLELTVRLSAPLSCSTNPDPTKPLTLPPIV